MRLQCLAGAYAGQVREYGAVAGLAALRVGTAARIGDVGPVRQNEAAVPVVAAKVATSVSTAPRRRHR